MVKIYRASECELIGAGGYGRKYVADIKFRAPVPTAGFIWVKIPPRTRTEPHAHQQLEEVFVTMASTVVGVGDRTYSVGEGDVVVVEPGEPHWFETGDNEVVVIAVKCPDLKDDKITVD